MKKLIFALFTFISTFASASHIVGGEVYYDSLGNDMYRVTFEIYRDCAGSNFDSPLQYTVFNDNGTIYSQYSIPLPTPDTLAVVYDDPCVTPPTDICVERAIYIDTITLPATVAGYYMTYQRCCWAGNIINIVDPGDWGLTIRCDIPGTDLVTNDNNSARFNNYPPIVLCSGQTFDFDHSAFDLDGDSLVYSICTPPTINISVGAEPNPEAPEPYADVLWETGFSGTAPFGTGSTMVIDPQTGLLSITPGLLGTFVAAVCVEEYRDGVLINQKSRTYGYRVTNCEVEIPLQVELLGAGDLIEDCGEAGFIISRDDSTDAIGFQIFLSGTAINGTDYNFLPDTMVMNAGIGTDTISITPFLDGITEGDEDIIFNIVIENICEGTFDTTTAYITIVDYINMSMTHEDSINICSDLGDQGLLWCSVQNGVPPYFFDWSPISYANNDTIVFPATDLNDNLNIMNVAVWDQCGKMIASDEIKVYNRCPLGPPNVITANGDGVNDFFIIKNIEDYDRVEVIIFNRWGVIVFEDANYQNNWSGLDRSGNELSAGVYTYIVTPESEKYIYDDNERTEFTGHGFVQIIRD